MYKLDRIGYTGIHLILCPEDSCDIIYKISKFGKSSLKLIEELPDDALILKKYHPVFLSKIKVSADDSNITQVFILDGVLNLSLNLSDVITFIEALHKIKQGETDYNIYIGGKKLWFW